MNRIKLINAPTPLHKLNYRIGKTRIYMKRDDLIGFGGGGNKVRLFEYIAQDIINQGAKKIITFGSIHSNHVRVAAVVASKLGIGCDIIILDDESAKSNGSYSPNLKLIDYCKDTNIVYCKIKDAHSFIDSYLASQKSKGIDYYWVPGGGHMPIALQGYVNAGNELLEQSETMQFNPDAVFVPCGTGTTQAGLIKGISDFTQVIGITVSRDIGRCREEIKSLLGKDGLYFEKKIMVLPNSIGYGENDAIVNSMITELIKSDGIFLDPIYNAKSFLVMVNFIKKHSEFRNVVYVNTGGYPNLFI